MGKIHYVFLIAFTLILQGCGTIILDPHSPIVIEGKKSDKTQYFIYNTHDEIVASGYAPEKVRFKSSYNKVQGEEYKVLLKPVNQDPELYKITRGVSGWIFVSFNLIPIDLITDHFRVFPEVKLD